MTGYHFTSYSSWSWIKSQGLQPYRLSNDGDTSEFDKMGITRGIFIFDKPSTNIKDEIGCVIRQLATKNTLDIVQLKVEYSRNDKFHWSGDRITITHSGKIEDFHYHKNKRVIVLFNPIPPTQIELVRRYDLAKMFLANRSERTKL